MRRLLVVSLLSFPGAFGADIPPGTHVLLRMTNSISTRTARQGDQVYFQTASPIAAEGKILVPAGSYVQGTVSDSKRSGRVSGRAELTIHLDTLLLASGKSLKFSPRLASADSNESGQRVEGNEGTVKQAPGKGQDAGRVAIVAGSGAAIGGLADHSWTGAGIGGAAGGAVGLATVLLTRGHEVELRSGATLDVIFDRPLAIE